MHIFTIQQSISEAMKFLKYIFFLLLVVVIVGALYFGTKDGSYSVAESKVMNAPASVIYDNVKDYKNWENWGPWMKQDPDIKINYAEKTEGEGASYSWSSDDMEVGDGAMETVKVIPNKEIEQTISFNTPIGDSKSDVFWKFEPIAENPAQTKVTWGMKGEQSLLEKVFMSFQDTDLETEISKMYQEGLTNLDRDVQGTMQRYEITIDGITKYGGGYYLYATTAARLQDISIKKRQLMGEVSGYMSQNNIDMAGPPFTIYNQMDETNGTAIFSTGIPVREKIETPKGSPVISGFMDPVTTIKVILKGDYKNLQEAYAKGNEYIATNGYIPHPSAKMFEVYPTDPQEVANPANWITEIYLPILESDTPQ